MSTSTVWLEVLLSCPLAQAPYLQVGIEELGYRGWVEESTAEETRCRVYLAQEPGWEERLGQLERTAAFAEGQLSTGPTVQDVDWAENWKKFYHPLEVGNRLVVCPSWEKFQPRPDQLVMVLDPGSAFGTGYHGSTKLCLELVEKVAAPGLTLLDWGTGSGILAIAAFLLGVRELEAIDNDPVAVKVANENFAINGMTSVEAHLSATGTAAAYDLITANLIASTLIELAADLKAHLKPGGHLIAGGIIDIRHGEVVTALEEAGLKLLETRHCEDWVALLMSA